MIWNYNNKVGGRDMDASTRIAFAEIDLILNLLDIKYSSKIPAELRYTFNTQKELNYQKDIDVKRPLTEQNLTKETVSILALLNYQYWCETEEEKNELIKQLIENDRKAEKEYRDKYNPANMFKQEKERLEKIVEETKAEQQALATKKNKSFFSKIIDKIKSIFKK